MGALDSPTVGIRIKAGIHEPLISLNGLRRHTVHQLGNEAQVGAAGVSVVNLYGQDILTLVEQLPEIVYRLLLVSRLTSGGGRGVMRR